ncbi:MAG: hypothetical protein K6E38_07435 [Fretibacterium sp.]|nr:hypothetical protein [Fretibacterium sp.]
MELFLFPVVFFIPVFSLFVDACPFLSDAFLELVSFLGSFSPGWLADEGAVFPLAPFGAFFSAVSFLRDLLRVLPGDGAPGSLSSFGACALAVFFAAFFLFSMFPYLHSSCCCCQAETDIILSPVFECRQLFRDEFWDRY